MSEILKDSKKLFDLGFGILWLRPREKRPVRSGWTTGKRESWDELVRSYRPGYNVGVRLGAASRVGNGYLACFDLDIKDPSSRKKAISALSAVVQGRLLPEVRSGSGNGSRHLYFITKEPFKMVTIAKDPGHWELVAYSDGRQMALSPSIHPSGGKYAWKRPIGKTLPLFDLSSIREASVLWGGKTEKNGATSNLGKNAKQVSGGNKCDFDETLDVRWDPRIAESIRTLIVDGKWKGKVVTDRSAFLMTASASLLSAGLDQSQVLGILTDKSTFLGQCAFDHAKTKDRAAAARWLSKYTVAGASNEREAKVVNAFQGEVENEKLDDWEAEIQSDEMEDDVSRSRNNGFYLRGKGDALKPDYGALLKEFEREKPFKTLVDMKSVYRFNGTHYEHFTPYEIKAFAEEKFCPKPEERLRSEFYHKVLANNIAHRSFFSETTEGKINFKNGVLDVDGFMGLGTHSAEYGFRSVLPYDYDPEARCPRFEKWISETMKGDGESIRVLQEYMGYIVRGGEYRYHKALWLQGTGRNGKSTFIDVLKALIGSENYSTISIKALVGDKFMNAELDGRLANFSEETSTQELSDSGPFKNLTGDGESSAQKKFGDPFKFRNRAKLIMSYNEKPDLKDLSPGMLSRPIIIPFERVLKENEQDKTIKEKLLSELPGIFNFALKGWERLSRQNEFTKCQKSDFAKRSVEEESCNVLQWIRHYVEFTDDRNDLKSPGDLYTAYRSHERYPYALNKFCKRINAHAEIRKHKKEMREGNRYWGVVAK